MRFSAVVVLVSLVASGFATTVVDVGNDIAAISAKLSVLDASISGYPTTGGTLTQALVIHNNAVALAISINKGNNDAKGLLAHFTNTEGRTILTSLKGTKRFVISALNGIVTKKSAFAALPLGNVVSLIRRDLIDLNNITEAFENALIAVSDPSLLAEAIAFRNEIHLVYVNTLAAYGA